MEYECKENVRQYMRAIDGPVYELKKSLIAHSGKTKEEAKALWAFIDEALANDIDVICRDEGYYIISRDANRGSVAHNTYECLIRNDKEMEKTLSLIKKHLGEVWK